MWGKALKGVCIQNEGNSTQQNRRTSEQLGETLELELLVLLGLLLLLLHFLPLALALGKGEQAYI